MAKAVGREKAIQNSFLRLKAKPEDYSPLIDRVYLNIQHCELCGMPITYAFKLAHNKSESKSVYVGSDCIITAVGKSLAQNVVEALIEKMKRLVEEEKAKAFKEEYPNFIADLRSTAEAMRTLIRTYNLGRDYVYGSKKLPILDTFSTAEDEVRRKGYTTGPKVEAVYKAKREVESGQFEDLLKEHQETVGSERTIKDDQSLGKEQEEFYNLYLGGGDNPHPYAKYMGWDKNPAQNSKALSLLEKDIFLSHLEGYIARRGRLKKKMKRKKAEIMSTFEKRLLDVLKVKEIEGNERHVFGYYTLESEKEKYADYTHCVDVGALQSALSYSIRDIIEEYGMERFRGLVETLANEQKLLELTGVTAMKAPYGYSRHYIFKEHTEAETFVKAIRSEINSIIKQFEEFVDSDDEVTLNENFN